MPCPKVVLFDIMQTVFDLEPLKERLLSAGLPTGFLHPWLMRTLRDGFVLAVTDKFVPFREVAKAALIAMSAEQRLHATEAHVEEVLAGFPQLPAHADVAPAFETLNAAGVPIAAFSNSSEDTMRAQLAKAGLATLVHEVISVDEARAWKPRREAYDFAVRRMGAAAGETALVAGHSWDCHGAKHAGLMTGWVRRLEASPDPLMHTPDVTGTNLIEVVDKLLAL